MSVIETGGRGAQDIARLMREQRHEPPIVALREGAVVMTFQLPVKALEKTPQITPEETPGKAPGQTDMPVKTPVKTSAAILGLLRDEPTSRWQKLRPAWASRYEPSNVPPGSCAIQGSSSASARTRAATGR